MTNETPKMSLDELRETSEFKHLTAKQRMFVCSYVSSGGQGQCDATFSIQSAYGCRSEKVALIMSYSMLANIKIIEVLNRYFGADPTEEFLKILNRAIYNKRITIAQVQALKLKCDVLGLANKLPNQAAYLDKTLERIKSPKPKKEKKLPATKKKTAKSSPGNYDLDDFKTPT